jgi:NAD(P)-dependent dehydrogenase (short-subunit alcohol dehydrogenase family)
MNSLAGKRVLVTGGAVRIGRAICRAFAAAGARVVIHYRHSQREAEELASELTAVLSGHLTIAADLTDAAARDRLVERVVAAAGGLDVLVNNASVYRRSPLRAVDADRLRLDYDINFVAPFLLARDFLRLCRTGCVIHILDQRVARVEPGAGAYGLAKKSLRDAMEAAAVEWAPGVRVNAVAPGIVLAPPGVDAAGLEPLLANVPMGVASRPEEIAEACVYLAQAETVTGQVLYVDGGLHLSPYRRMEVQEADYSGARPAAP